MNKYILISSLFLIVLNLAAQTNSFLPMQLGNEYQYNDGSNYWYWKMNRDTIYSNGNRYFSFPDFLNFGDCRIDSAGNLLSISKPFFLGGDPDEYLLFKADAQINEVWPIAWNYNSLIDTGYGKCIYDSTLLVFGELRRVKGTLIFDESYQYYLFWLVEGIGLFRDQYDDGSGLILNFAIVDSIRYGELLDVKENSSELPSDFFVSQNYPNPFNGLTNIDITLNGSAGMEKLIIEIYDILGKKVYEKEYTPFKTFTIRINSDYLILSSGTYIYSILFNNKRISKKFILLK